MLAALVASCGDRPIPIASVPVCGDVATGDVVPGCAGFTGLPDARVLRVPDDAESLIVDLKASSSPTDNLYVFKVDDVHGRINGLLPTKPEYAAARQSASIPLWVNRASDQPNTGVLVGGGNQLQPGDLVSFALETAAGPVFAAFEPENPGPNLLGLDHLLVFLKGNVAQLAWETTPNYDQAGAGVEDFADTIHNVWFRKTDPNNSSNQIQLPIEALVFDNTGAPTVIQPSGLPYPADTILDVYDTAWDLPYWAELAEVETYFNHLNATGFTGVWLSLLNHTGGGPTAGAPRINGPELTIEPNGELTMNPEHVARMVSILDMAHARGLEVGLVPAWGVAYTTGFANSACGPGPGILTAANSQEWGAEVGAAFGAHPAIAHWIFGGDNFCDLEPVEIWQNLDVGFNSVGATQPVTYHTAGWPARHLTFATEPWVDFLSPQTSHCQEEDATLAQLNAVISATGKPVWAAEPRYEAMEPSWTCAAHGPGNPVTGQDVVDDAQAALTAGVAAIVYGHNERWGWGTAGSGSTNQGWIGVEASFGAPGETALFDLLTN